ncbi:MAG: NAD(P)-dependent oxidoreductase [Opitutales bacterium]
MSTATTQSALIVRPEFDANWPLAADHFHRIWVAEGAVHFERLGEGDGRTVGEILGELDGLRRIASLGPPLTKRCLKTLQGVREVGLESASQELKDACYEVGMRLHVHDSEGFWGQSVAECALALILNGLRRIPQLHRTIIESKEPWNYQPPDGPGRGQPGARGIQFGDDAAFANGTLAGKRVRIVGAGNIASRVAAFCSFLGAEVAAWDPYASEPCFHRAGARRVHHLEQLLDDAEIFCPLLPLRPSTEGLVSEAHLRQLPRGCLVVLVTRAGIVNMDTLRARVLADDLSLAADVFDREPLPLDDPLLGRHNVVHTPHIAGRTAHANQQWAEMLAARFDPLEAIT